MPPYQSFERTFILRFNKAIEKLPIGRLDRISRLQGLPNTIEDLAKRMVRHLAPPFLAGLGLCRLVPRQGRFIHFSYGKRRTGTRWDESGKDFKPPLYSCAERDACFQATNSNFDIIQLAIRFAGGFA